MTAEEFYAKYGSDRANRSIIENAASLTGDRFEAQLKAKYPELKSEDISDLYDEVSDTVLTLDDLHESAGGVQWKKKLVDPDKPSKLK